MTVKMWITVLAIVLLVCLCVNGERQLYHAEIGEDGVDSTTETHGSRKLLLFGRIDIPGASIQAITISQNRCYLSSSACDSSNLQYVWVSTGSYCYRTYQCSWQGYSTWRQCTNNCLG